MVEDSKDRTDIHISSQRLWQVLYMLEPDKIPHLRNEVEKLFLWKRTLSIDAWWEKNNQFLQQSVTGHQPYSTAAPDSMHRSNW